MDGNFWTHQFKAAAVDLAENIGCRRVDANVVIDVLTDAAKTVVHGPHPKHCRPEGPRLQPDHVRDSNRVKTPTGSRGSYSLSPPNSLSSRSSSPVSPLSNHPHPRHQGGRSPPECRPLLSPPAPHQDGHYRGSSRGHDPGLYHSPSPHYYESRSYNQSSHSTGSHTHSYRSH